MTALTSNRAAVIDVTLIIDGIPVLFGTRAGLVLDTSSIFTAGAPASMTSVDAIAPGSLSLEGAKLDRTMLMVPPSGGAVSINSGAWDKYFERRRYTLATSVLTQDETAAATTFNVRQADDSLDDDVAYVDRECVLVGTSTTTTYPGLTRNYAGFTEKTQGAHRAGSFVSAVPRSLLGRMAEVRVWTSDTDHALLRRLVVSKVGWDGQAHQWVIAFSDAMSTFDRVIAKGTVAYNVTRVATSSTYAAFTLDVNGDNSQFLNHGLFGSLLIANDEMSSTMQIYQYSSGTVQTYYGVSTYWANSESQVTARRVYEFTGSPMIAALRVLLSDKGDGDNHATYDVLYGKTSSLTGGAGETTASNEPEIRFGAAISADLIDITTLASFVGDPGIGWHYVLGANGEEKLLDLLEEVAWQCQIIWFINSDGKLSAKRMSGVYATTTIDAALTENELLRDGSLKCVDDETEIITGVKFNCNYDFLQKKHLGEVNIHYGKTEEIYRDIGQVLSIERKGMHIALPQEGGTFNASSPGVVSVGLNELQRRMDRIFFRAQNGIRKYSISLPFRFYTLAPGDVVTMVHSGLKTFDGNMMTSAFTCEVTSQGAINFSTGRVEFEVSETWSGKLISPTSRISTWAAGTPNRANLTANSQYGDGATPQAYWAIGWKVYILDATDYFATKSALLTVSGLGATYLEVGTTAVGFTPAVGDIIVQANYDDASSAALNTANTLKQRGYVFLSDANGLLGSSDAEADLWG